MTEAKGNLSWNFFAPLNFEVIFALNAHCITMYQETVYNVVQYVFMSSIYRFLT
jgi:hypothetical protein